MEPRSSFSISFLLCNSYSAFDMLSSKRRNTSSVSECVLLFWCKQNQKFSLSLCFSRSCVGSGEICNWIKLIPLDLPSRNVSFPLGVKLLW